MHDAVRSQSNCKELVSLSQGPSVKNLLSTFIYPAASLIAYPTISDYQAADLRIYPRKSMTELWLPIFLPAAQKPSTRAL